jgi:uncharacterized protein (DUF433 family)
MSSLEPNDLILTLDQLISEATALPDAAKAILIDKVMESMTEHIDRDILTKTLQTAQQRIAEIDRRIVQPIPGNMPLAQVQHIEKTPGVVAGDACIRSTRIPVWELVEYRQLGASNNKILEAYPQLTELDLQAAWEYDRRFPNEIAAAIAANEAA